MGFNKIYANALLRLRRVKELIKKNPQKAGVIIFAGIIILSFVVIKFGSKDNLPVSQDVYVQVQNVKSESIDNLSELSGTLEPIEEATVSFEVSGTVNSLNVQEGSEVKIGEILANVDSQNYDLQAQQAQGAAEQAGSALSQVQSAYNQATISFQRSETLYNAGAISKSDYENAQNSLSAAAEQKQQASAAYKQAYSAEQQAELAAAKTSLKATINGVVISKYISKGQLVSAGAPACKIGNIDKLKVSLLVPDSEISSWKKGDKISVNLYDKLAEGEVTNIFPSTNEKTGGITVEVTVDNADRKWYSGQVVTCSHKTDRTAAIYVPKEAVISNGGSSAYVFLLHNNIAVKTEVTIGTLKNNLFEIKSGIQENEMIIIKGADRLSDGDKVKVIGSDK